MTKQARGYKGQVLIDFETDFGVAPAAPLGRLVPYNTIDGGATRSLNAAATIRGNRHAAKPFSGNTSLSRTVVVPLDTRNIGLWLMAMFGEPVTTGTGPYVHVFKPGDTQPSMVTEIALPDVGVYLRGAGVKVASLDITVGGDGEQTVSFGLVGKDEVKQAATYDATPASMAFDRLETFAASIKEGGVAMPSRIAELSMRMDMGLDTTGYTIGDAGTLGDIPEGIMNLSGSLTALFKDTSLMDKAEAGTETSLEVQFTSGGASLSIKLPEVIYNRAAPAMNGPQGVRERYDYQAYHDDAADASSVIITLTNDVASYSLA